MKVFIAGKNEAGQRFDKYLGKLLREAPKSFIYKMLRKKNITLNGQKASGSEKLEEGDTIRLFLSDETFEKFSQADRNRANPVRQSGLSEERAKERAESFARNIIYEDDDLLFWNKPHGMLSQPDSSGSDSVADLLREYMLTTGKLTADELSVFNPAPVNRLDRNTSGIVLCGVSLKGLQFLSKAVHDRTICKKYLCVIFGELKDGRYDAWLKKNESDNTVTVRENEIPGGKNITTIFTTIKRQGPYAAAEAELVTGRTHQIRAHLSHLGCGILGDPKYGNPKVNREVRERYGVKYQMLHASSVSFKNPGGDFEYLTGKVFRAEPPAEFHRFL